MAAQDVLYPSVQIVERTYQPGASALPTVSTVAAFIGKSNQGPTTPTIVTSWSDFLTKYGTTYTDLHSAVSDYFNNGGQYAYIDRLPGVGSSTASVNVYASDAPEDPQNPGTVLPGTPPLFTVTALNPGAWANRIYVAAYSRDTTNKRFDVSIFSVPTGVSFDPTKRNSDLLLEQWSDVTLDRFDARYLYDVVNSPSGSGSSFVSFSGQTYDPSQPSVRPYPNTSSAKQLAGGADGSYLSPFDPVSAYQASILDMTSVPQSYLLNIPNINDASIIKYAVSTAAARGDIFVLIDTPQGLAPVDAVTYVQSTLALGSLGSPALPSYAAVFYPWVYMPTVGASTPNKTTLRAPGGAIAGLMMGIDNAYGVWQSPAGTRAPLSGAVDLERKFTSADLSKLNNANVNVIRPTTGGITVMGARTLKMFGLDMYISNRRSIISLREQLREAMEFALFLPNAQPLWTRITNTGNTILGKFWASGGLKGGTSKDAFYVKCDVTNNTVQAQQAGTVNVEVGIALASPAEFVIISIGQFDGATSVSTSV